MTTLTVLCSLCGGTGRYLYPEHIVDLSPEDHKAKRFELEKTTGGYYPTAYSYHPAQWITCPQCQGAEVVFIPG